VDFNFMPLFWFGLIVGLIVGSIIVAIGAVIF
jgi:hypothetical protein